jgi:predicted nucleic acid-binding protein
MIIVDTNIITYLFIEGENTKKAENAFKKDTKWAAPILWRSEFRNVLAFYIRNQDLELDNAIKIMNEADQLMSDYEYDVTSLDVLKLAALSGCSAYDCEFVALAKDLRIPLLTFDKKVLKAFPKYTISLENYIRF